MPSPIRTRLFAAALLAATPAYAEMTEADKAGMQAFAACLDEADSDEEDCIEKLGRFAWYPRDDAVCAAVGARVERVIKLDGLPKWRHMYMNERCVRMGLPHGATGAVSGGHVDRDNPLARCVNAVPWKNFCLERYGRQDQYPVRDDVCPRITSGLARQKHDGEKHAWSMLFYNERCRRLGMNHYGSPQ